MYLRVAHIIKLFMCPIVAYVLILNYICNKTRQNNIIRKDALPPPNQSYPPHWELEIKHSNKFKYDLFFI